jgi:hypothetical protein
LPSVLPGIQLRGAIPAGAIANSVVTGDFNNDGYMDFVVANGGTNDLWLYLGNGSGTFQLPQIIPLTKGLTPVYLATADLRGIGVLDLIVAEFDTATVGVLLGNGDGTFGYEQEYLLPQPPGALVINDFNHDGKLDIVSVMLTLSSNTQQVQYLATLLGDGTGSFAAPLISMNPGFYSTADSIASGDVNNDGFPDVLITGPGLENSQVYLNAGDGTFTPGATVVSNGPVNTVLAGALADVNGDGCLDALVADAIGFVWVALGDCGGSFGPLAYVPMGDSNDALIVTDMNGDGYPDIVTTTYPALDGDFLGDVAGNMLCVAFGNGQGGFAPGQDYVGTGMSYSLAIADFNGDGHPDVVSASPDTDTATVYLNNGSGGFGFPQGEWIGLAGVGVVNSPVSGASFADVNGDGSPDIVLQDEGYNGEYLIVSLLNDGTGNFATPIASDAGISITSDTIGDYRLGNFRNTGHLDFLAIGSTDTTGAQFILFAPGNGDGTFGKSTFIATPGAVGEMGVADFNQDGKLDFVAVGPNPNGTGEIVTMFLGNGDGTFRNAGSTAFTDSAQGVAGVFAADFNRDGKPDVLIYDTGNGYWTTASYIWEFLGNGDGTFQPGQQLFSAFQPMTMADMNGDSWLDIVRYDFFWPDGTTQTFGPAKFTTYLDQPSGAFTQSSSYAPYAGVPQQAFPFLQDGDPMASSKVGDLNGDGKPDEIAFQQVSQGTDVYAQILMGNGDGTFTPTYDVFDFQKEFYFPGYAHILDGTTFSDLLEIDGATSSMHVFKGGPAPTFQLGLEEAQLTGNSGCGWIFLNVPSSSNTSVALSTSVTGVVLPTTVTVPAGALSQQFCYTLGSTYNWRQVFNIQAQLGTTTAVAYASQSYVVGFSEALSPGADQAVYPTQSTAPITVSLTSSHGYSSTVGLSCLGLLAGEACNFASATLNVSPTAVASTTLVVSTSETTEGIGPIVIVASDENVTQREAINLAVQPLIVNAASSTVAVTSPGTGTGDIIIQGIPPYAASCSGLPAGASCSFSGNQLPYPSQTNLTMSVAVASGVATGTYPFTVGVASGPVPASVGVTLYVGDFSLQPPSAGTAWAPPNGTVNVNLTAQSIDDFSTAIIVTCSLDVGGSCTGGTFPVSPNGPTPISLAVSPPSGVSLGAHTLTVTATSGPLTQSINFPFNVADYSGSLSESTVTIAQGASALLTATVTATSGFAGTVSFACSGATQVTCSFSPLTVQPTGSGSQTTNITVTAGSPAAKLAARDPAGSRLLSLVLVLPFWIVFGTARNDRMRAKRAAVGLFLLTLVIASMSCGGGSGGGGNGGGSGGGGGGGGSANYTITVNATAAGTNTTRALGTIAVTVTN